jgi:thymidylate kinase
MIQEALSSGYLLLEGMDFTGKSTISKLLAEELTKKGPIEAIYHRGYFSNLNTETEILNPEEKENFYRKLFFEDKKNTVVQPKLIIQDRYFPSILFYGNIMNSTEYPTTENMNKLYLMPRGVLLFERSFEEIKEMAQQRKHLASLEKKSLESKKQFDYMRKQYRELISRLGVWSTIIDSSKSTIENTLQNSYEQLTNSEILVEDVKVDDLCVSWEPRVYKSTAEKCLNKINNGELIEPLVIHRKFDPKTGIFIDLVEDGRHRAYAHYLANMVTARAYIQRISIDSETIKTIKTTKLKDFTFK